MARKTGGSLRRHRVFITDNTEYHLRGRRCIAVRRRTGEWQCNHKAVGRTVAALIEPDGIWRLADAVRPRIGMRLCFDADLMTTVVRDIERPSVSAIDTYVSLERAR